MAQLQLVLQPPRGRRGHGEDPFRVTVGEFEPVAGQAGVLPQPYAREAALGIGEAERERLTSPFRSTDVSHSGTIAARTVIRSDLFSAVINKQSQTARG